MMNNDVMMEEKQLTLTKAQKRKLKKEIKRKEKERIRAERERQRKIRNLKKYGATIIIVIIIAAFFYWKSLPPKNASIIEVSPKTYNFGTVSQAKGVVSGIVKVKNIGNEDLIINNMDTSCGCTSAAMIYNGVEGPRFSMSMHGTNPKDWSLAIPSGKTAELKIYYDPNVHKDLRGPVTRSVSLFSNDPKHKNTEVRINVNQVD
ncbi:DUF1573 domain-containing protein [Candidatus Woesearchaeota archaeon]|nr:MAG: DUF1573 domain-containing protein [Candidatus Woesearchaeota archaeon]